MRILWFGLFLPFYQVSEERKIQREMSKLTPQLVATDLRGCTATTLAHPRNNLVTLILMKQTLTQLLQDHPTHLDTNSLHQSPITLRIIHPTPCGRGGIHFLSI